MSLDNFSLPSLIAIGLSPFVLLFIVRRPHTLLTLVFFCTPYQMSLLGGAGGAQGSIVDLIALLLCIPLVISLFTRPIVWHPVATAICLFLGACLLSTILNGMDRSAVLSFVRMAMITLVPVLVFLNLPISDRQVNHCIYAFLAGSCLLAIFQGFTFLTSGINAAMYTLNLHKNFIGAIMGCATGVALSQLLSGTSSPRRRFWLIFALSLCSAGLILSLSRGAWLATLGGCALLIILTGRLRAAIGAAVIGITVIAAVWSLLPDDATDYATDLNYRTQNVQSRLHTMDLTIDAFESSPFIGRGIGLRRYIEPHNVLVLALGETGILGTLFLIGMFVYPFWSLKFLWKTAPEVSKPIVLCAITFLTISFLHGMFDVYWRRGPAFIAWGMVGLAYIHSSRNLNIPQKTDPSDNGSNAIES